MAPTPRWLLGQLQTPAPLQRELFSNWMIWVLLVAAVILVLLVLSRRQDQRVRRR